MLVRHQMVRVISLESRELPALLKGKSYHVRYRVPTVHRVDREMIGIFIGRLGDNVEGPSLCFSVGDIHSETIRVRWIASIIKTNKERYRPRKVTLSTTNDDRN